MDIKFKREDRGFLRGEFEDLYGVGCSIQESSLATDKAIWFGGNSDRMHLSREMVAGLIPELQWFVDTGKLRS